VIFISEHIDRPILIAFPFIDNIIHDHVYYSEDLQNFGAIIINGEINPQADTKWYDLSFIIDRYGESDFVIESVQNTISDILMDSAVDSQLVGDIINNIPMDILLYGSYVEDENKYGKDPTERINYGYITNWIEDQIESDIQLSWAGGMDEEENVTYMMRDIIVKMLEDRIKEHYKTYLAKLEFAMILEEAFAGRLF